MALLQELCKKIFKRSIWVYHANPLPGPASRAASEVWSHYAGVWHLGSDTADSTVNRTTLFELGAVPAAAWIGGGHDLAGTGPYLMSNPAPALAIAGNLTLSLWARVRSIDPVSFDANPFINNSVRIGGFIEYHYSFTVDSNLRLWSYWSGPGGGAASTTAAVTGVTGSWRHYAVTRAVASHATEYFYYDGAVVGDALDFTHGPDPIANTALWIGADQLDTSSLSLDAIVDEVRIEPVARSAAWVAAIHRSETLQLVSFGSIEGY